MKTILSIVSLLCITICNSQSKKDPIDERMRSMQEYVVMNNGDTIYGRVEFTIGAYVYFTNSKVRNKKITADEIKEFRTNDSKGGRNYKLTKDPYYTGISFKLSDKKKKIFIYKISDGKIILYSNYLHIEYDPTFNSSNMIMSDESMVFKKRSTDGRTQNTEILFMEKGNGIVEVNRKNSEIIREMFQDCSSEELKKERKLEIKIKIYNSVCGK